VNVGDAREFNTALLHAIREGLVETLGERPARAVAFYVDPAVALSNISAYAAHLERIFGTAAEPLELRLAQKLYAQLGLEFRVKENYRLPEYVREAWQQRGT
jgi:hypothetical protein